VGISIPILRIYVSVADFLLTPAMQKVLRMVFADPGRTFTLNELLAGAGGGHGSSQRQIDRLISVGVLTEEARRGRQRSIKANTAFFLYPELRSIAQKSFGLAEPLRDALEPFKSEIEEAFVFGSVAKGTDTQRSDVDLIVVGHASFMDLTAAMFKVEQALGRPIHLSLYTPGEWANLKATDQVLSQISEGSKMRLLPYDTPG
jgi:predicted nucleotidyltransferase